jgi:hypothetical protein
MAARIAETLESQFAVIAENQPEVLARHFTEAGMSETAIQYWSKAGERALQRSANDVEEIARAGIDA